MLVTEAVSSTRGGCSYLLSYPAAPTVSLLTARGVERTDGNSTEVQMTFRLQLEGFFVVYFVFLSAVFADWQKKKIDKLDP